jgi:hypothetical protein
MLDYFRPYALYAGVIAGLTGMVLLLLSLIPSIGVRGLVLVWVVYAGSGMLALERARRQGVRTSRQRGAVDGAIAGAFAGIIAHAGKWGVDILITLARAMMPSSAGSLVPSLIGSVIFGLIGVVLGILAAGFLGAIGGLVFTTIQSLGMDS